MSAFQATVKEILSGDCVVLIEPPKEGPPPEKILYLSGVMAPKVAMRSAKTERDDDPFGHDAREFIRLRLIGKKVSVTIDDRDDNQRQYGQLLCEGENINVAILRAGLAKVRGARQGTVKNLDEFLAAEAAAKKEKLGLWTDDELKIEKAVRQIQWIALDGPLTKAFVNLHRNQVCEAVVDYIRDGGCYKVYFPDLTVYAHVLLSGVQVDGFKRIDGCSDIQPEPYAYEAKYFVDVRILNRRVNVRIEDADESGSIYASVTNPDTGGNLALLLLRNGFAKIRESNVRLVENPGQYRQMEKDAQKDKIRKWKGWEPPEAVEAVKEYLARVLEIPGGDFVVVVPTEGDDREEKKLFLATIRCPRMGTRTRPHEPWAHEAKEFVRKKLIGKKVTVVVEYSRRPVPNAAGVLPPVSDSSGRTHFVSIYLDRSKPSINELLINEGLAKIAFARNDEPRADNFDLLVQKEKEAAEKKIGIHGPSSPKFRINELSGPENAGMAKGFEESLKRLGKVEGVVDHVIHGGKFRIRIVSESILIAFVLAGIRCPQGYRAAPGQRSKPAESFAEEALQFSRDHVMQRPVTIKVEACDRGGNFIGILWLGTTCFNVRLVEQGLASMNDIGLVPGSIRAPLEEAETSAKEKRLALWSVPGALDVHLEDAENGIGGAKIEIPECVVSLCSAVNDFYIQELPVSNIELLQGQVNSYVQELVGLQASAQRYSQAAPPRIGDVVLSKFSEDQAWYRGKIESLDCPNMKFKVVYIDFGNSESVGLSDIYKCPTELQPTKCRPMARHCGLSGVSPAPDMEAEGGDALDSISAGQIFRCVVESLEAQTKKSLVQLYPLQSPSQSQIAQQNGGPQPQCSRSECPGTTRDVSVNEEIVASGWAMVQRKAKTELSDVLLAAEMKARKKRLNVWRHGDIDEDYTDDRDYRGPSTQPKGRSP